MMQTGIGKSVRQPKPGSKEEALRRMRKEGTLPKHAAVMLDDGAPADIIRLDNKRPTPPQPAPVVTFPSKPVVDMSDKAVIKREADRRWRDWVPTADMLTRPRVSTFARIIRAERKKVADAAKAAAKEAKATAEAQPTETDVKTNLKTKTTTKKPTKPSTERRKRPARATAAPKAPKVKEPRGMVIEILKLASRPNGASRDELNTLTKWKGAPWKWLFKNPKKNGYCDRWDYTFEVLEGKDGEARYKVTKKD